MAKNHPTLFSWDSLHPVTAAFYCWCWTANPWKWACIPSRIYKCNERATGSCREVSYHLGASLPSSASGTWVNYIMLFGSELTILFIPWRQINFASVPLCAQISCFLDFTPLILSTNRFLLSFHLQLNLYRSLHDFAQLRKTTKFPVSAQLAGLLRLFLKHRKLPCCLFCLSSRVYDHSPKFAMLAQFPGAWSPWKLSQDFWNTSPNSDNLTLRSWIAKLSSPCQPVHLLRTFLLFLNLHPINHLCSYLTIASTATENTKFCNLKM